MPPASDLILTQWRRQIDSELAASLRYGEGCPTRLADAIRYSMLAPGKRLRPLLVLASANGFGATIEETMPAALAMEMFHVFTLIHDDLPSMDNDDTRRGRPACHVQFGEATAILTGVALMAQAFQQLSTGIANPVSARRATELLSKIAGPEEMAGGQLEDLNLSDSTDVNPKRLESIYLKKTGLLFGVCARIGGLLGNADANQQDALGEFGENLGIAFQIVDDLIDYQSDSKNRITYPAIVGVDACHVRIHQLIETPLRELPVPPESRAQLESLVQRSIHRDRSERPIPQDKWN